MPFPVPEPSAVRAPIMMNSAVAKVHVSIVAGPGGRINAISLHHGSDGRLVCHFAAISVRQPFSNVLDSLGHLVFVVDEHVLYQLLQKLVVMSILD